MSSSNIANRITENAAVPTPKLAVLSISTNSGEGTFIANKLCEYLGVNMADCFFPLQQIRDEGDLPDISKSIDIFIKLLVQKLPFVHEDGVSGLLNFDVSNDAIWLERETCQLARDILTDHVDVSGFDPLARLKKNREPVNGHYEMGFDNQTRPDQTRSIWIKEVGTQACTSSEIQKAHSNDNDNKKPFDIIAVYSRIDTEVVCLGVALTNPVDIKSIQI